MDNENHGGTSDSGGSAVDLVEREMTEEKAHEVFDTITGGDGPTDVTDGDGGGGDGKPDREKLMAIAISLMFIAGGLYAVYLGVRVLRLELSSKGGTV